VATAGLPIWVTELDVNEPDVSERAGGLEDALRVAFSHPAVEGVLLWGFWNKTHWRPHASLVDGDNFEVANNTSSIIKMFCAFFVNKIKAFPDTLSLNQPSE